MLVEWIPKTPIEIAKYFLTRNVQKSLKKHSIIELYKYSQESEANVHEYRYHQIHLVGMLSDEVIIDGIAGCYSY